MVPGKFLMFVVSLASLVVMPLGVVVNAIFNLLPPPKVRR